MVRALRITGVLVAVLAVAVLGSVLGFVPLLDRDTSQDEKAAEVLNAPGAVERFRAQHGDKAPTNQDKTPLLVQQAQQLAGILNPPVEVERPTPPPRTTTTTTIRRPATSSSAKFDLVGTSYLASAPHESFAYIRLPGNEYQWVKQGSEVGHLVIKEVKSGSIVYADGQELVELAVEPVPETASLLESGTSAVPTMSGTARPDTSYRPVGRGAARPGLPTPASASTSSAVQSNEKDQEALDDLVTRLRDLQKNLRSDKTGTQVPPEDRAAMMNKLISEFKSSSQVSDQEAEKLDDLGEQLNGTKEKSAIERRREIMRRATMPPVRER
jgi:hypothetical protein